MDRNNNPSRDQIDLWNRYLIVANDYRRTGNEVLRTCGIERNDAIVELLRHSLKTPAEKDAALNVVRSIKVEAQEELFDELLSLASDLDVGSVNRAEQIILSFPRDWLVPKLTRASKQYLEDPDRISPEVLRLYIQVDHELTRSLAEAAATSGNKDRRDLGEFFLEKLGQEENG